MKRYIGTRTPQGCKVEVSDGERTYELDPRFDLRNHSPDGYEFGYNGSGPSQLSLALLADAVGDERAVRNYMDYKFRVIGRLEGDRFELSQDQVLQEVAQIEAERGRGR